MSLFDDMFLRSNVEHVIAKFIMCFIVLEVYMFRSVYKELLVVGGGWNGVGITCKQIN